MADRIAPASPELRDFYSARTAWRSAGEERMRFRKATALARVPAGAAVLDIGARDGGLRAFLPPSVRYQGIDIAPEFARPDVLIRDISKGIPFPDHSYDFVFCIEVLEHVPNPFATLAEFHRVLQPGGVLILSVPNPYHFKEIIWNLFRIPDRQVPVTRVRYAPANRETLAYRGTMVAAVRSPAGLLFAASLIQRQARVVARLCREEQLELVHAHWWIPGGVSAWLARRPYVVTLHGTDVALLERSLPARLLARRVLRGAAAVTAVSSFLAERVARAAGLDERSIVVQPMPADTRALTRTSRGGGGIVTVGRLSPQKRSEGRTSEL